MSDVSTSADRATARWSVGGSFLEALATRDYTGMATALGTDVRFRALLPHGPMQWQGRTEVAATFASWFGTADDFEVVDAVVGETGGRLHLSWRIRVRPAPFGIGEGWHVIEQHAYADATDTIESLDLLCSGFRATEGARSPV